QDRVRNDLFYSRYGSPNRGFGFFSSLIKERTGERRGSAFSSSDRRGGRAPATATACCTAKRFAAQSEAIRDGRWRRTAAERLLSSSGKPRSTPCHQEAASSLPSPAPVPRTCP